MAAALRPMVEAFWPWVGERREIRRPDALGDFEAWSGSIRSGSAVHRMPNDALDDRPSDGKWITKAELAAVRGIDLASASRLIRRRGWRRQPGNDGRIRVLVPVDFLASPTDGPSNGPMDSPADEATPAPPVPADVQTDAAPAPSDIEADIKALRHDLTVLFEQKMTAAEARAERAEAALAGERSRADVLRERLDTLTGELREAQETASALRQTGEVARRARGLLARLRAAWRGE